MTNRDQIIESLAEIGANVSNMNKRLNYSDKAQSEFRAEMRTSVGDIKTQLSEQRVEIKTINLWKDNHDVQHEKQEKNLNKWKFLISGSILSFIVGAGILGIKHFYESGKTNNNITEKNRRIAHDSESAE